MYAAIQPSANHNLGLTIMNAKLMSAGFGLVWAWIAVLLFGQGFTQPIPVSAEQALFIIFGPLVGLLVYYSSTWAYRKAFYVRCMWAIASVYLAGAVFTGIMGYVVAIEFGEALFYSSMAWWWMTAIPVFWGLFPFSILTHEAVRFAHQQRTAG